MTIKTLTKSIAKASVALAFLGAQSAFAATMTYDYVGANFTNFSTNTYFSTSDKLTGSIAIDFNGAGTYSAANGGLTSWSYSMTTSSGYYGIPGTATGTDSSVWGGGLSYTLDANANITAWSTNFTVSRPQGSEACRYTCRYAVFQSNGGRDHVGLAADRTQYLGWNGTAGTWTSTTAPSPVPLPAGGLLLLTGLAGVAAIKRRKKRAA